MLFGSAGEKMDRDLFCKAAGLTGSQLKTLCRLELISPLYHRPDPDQEPIGIQRTQ